MRSPARIMMAGMLALAGMAPIAHAQALTGVPRGAVFSESVLLERCTALQCVPSVRELLALLEGRALSPELFNSQIGLAAAVLFDAARRADQKALPDIAEGLRLLAAATRDLRQRQSILTLAGQIEKGGAGLFDLETPFAASPS